jgi:hypothetical protein
VGLTREGGEVNRLPTKEMSPHFQRTGPRSNAYSESKFTNWTVYDPFFAEARAALKRFDGRISRVPAFPHVIAIKPQTSDFIHACTRSEARTRLERMSPASRENLRAVFLLSGTRKQQKSWGSKLGCYGIYWNSCVFLFAHPFKLPRRYTLDDLRRFYLDDVLVHEVAHHLDRERITDRKAKENFAHAYVQQQSRS